MKPTPLPRQTLWDALEKDESQNIYCDLSDLMNEASVESFFLLRLLKDFGYADGQIKTKESLDLRNIGQGRKKVQYKPDYVLLVDNFPRCIIDAKATDESLENWIHQCSSYCLALNQDFPNDDPVHYFILSNGLLTQVFHWNNKIPILELQFSDFDYGNAKYQEMKRLLGARSIAKPSVPAPKSQDFTLIRPTSEEARRLFATCHDIIWKSEGSGPAPAFMEFVKIMFVKLWYDHKIREDEATKHLFTASNETRIPKSAVIFSSHWIEEREKEETPNPIDSILFENLRKDIERKVLERRKKRLFDQGERINLKSHTIKQVVSKLEHIDMFGIDEDLNGRLFETFLSATMRGRDLGQFFTPRSVVKMMTRIASLEATATYQDKVLDACCGSGGFLIEALTMMRNSIRANASLTTHKKEELMETVANNCLYGLDFGKDPPLARIARINMYLHGDGGSRIYYADALDKTLKTEADTDAEVAQDIAELRNALHEEKDPLLFSVILTNPPFSMKKEYKNEFERRILEQYTLSRKSPQSKTVRPSLRSSIMFIERYCELLKPEGRLITVIDDTLLASDQEMFKSIRDFIRYHFLIRAIISLPGDAFRRSGARVKTSVLVLEKKKKPSNAQAACMGFFSESIGVDDLTPRASESDISEARSKAEAETIQIVEGYQSYIAGKPLPPSSGCILLSPDRFTDRLDLKYCVPQTGRFAQKWKQEKAEIKKLRDCINLVGDEVIPKEYPDQLFTLIKVSYDGKCEVDKIRKGRSIKANSMYRVKAGHLVFSTIRATDGAIGIVPQEMDGALVSGSYSVFACTTEYDTAYLWAILRSHELRADMQSISAGSGRYVTYWPEVGEIDVPWLPQEEREIIGNGLIEVWAMERLVKEKRKETLKHLDRLDVESDASIHRWKSSKAPT